MTDTTAIRFGQYLRQLRQDAGYTQQEVAEWIRVDHTYLSKLEAGRGTVPSVPLLHRLAAVFNQPPEVVCEQAGRWPEEVKRTELEAIALRQQRELAGCQPLPDGALGEQNPITDAEISELAYRATVALENGMIAVPVTVVDLQRAVAKLESLRADVAGLKRVAAAAQDEAAFLRAALEAAHDALDTAGCAIYYASGRDDTPDAGAAFDARDAVDAALAAPSPGAERAAAAEAVVEAARAADRALGGMPDEELDMFAAYVGLHQALAALDALDGGGS